MRYLMLSLAVLIAQIAIADGPQIDKSLSLAAGRAYVESYLRWHLPSQARHVDWANATIEVITSVRHVS